MAVTSMLLQSEDYARWGPSSNYRRRWGLHFSAMPWANPQSLSVDETYAVTAYVMHLNGMFR